MFVPGLSRAHLYEPHGGDGHADPGDAKRDGQPAVLDHFVLENVKEAECGVDTLAKRVAQRRRLRRVEHFVVGAVARCEQQAVLGNVEAQERVLHP